MERSSRPLNIDELAERWQTSRYSVAMLRDYGLLKMIRPGQKYLIPIPEVERFERDTLGFDVSSPKKAAETKKTLDAILGSKK